MKNKLKIIRLSIFLLVVGIILLTISGRGCPKRRKDKIGSSNEWAGIAAPSSLTATAFSYSEIRLSWQDNSNNEDGFEVERSNDGPNFQLLTSVDPNVTSYPDTGLSWSTTYYYRVRAVNLIGDWSEWSNTASASTPSILPSLIWSSVTAGEYHTIALTTDGAVWAWGRNDDWWQLGIGDTSVISRTLPTLIASDFDYQPFTDVTAIFAGRNHNLALKTDGTLWGWGANGAGQLGTGDTATIEAPLQIGADSDWGFGELSRVASVATGYSHTIGLKSAGTLWAWGNNWYGQLGDGTTDTRTTPMQIGIESDWFSVAVGPYHTIGLKSAPAGGGTLWAWGYNWYGQLGDGTSGPEVYRTTPMQIGTELDWSAVAAGYHHTIGLKSAGTLWAWGHNWAGQLGDGTTDNRTTPRQIGVESDWSRQGGITTRYAHTIGLKNAGTLWAWGYNYYGQLGDGTSGPEVYRTTPRQIGAESDWSAVAAGYNHTIGLKSIGTIWAWGCNDYGQLGLGDTVNRNTPHLLGIPAIPSSLIATAIGLSQIAMTWTDNSNDEAGFKIERKIGNGTYEEIGTVGINITSYSDYAQDGFIPNTAYYYRVRAYNISGYSDYSNVVMLFPPSTIWSAITTGGYHSLTLNVSGTIWSWGNNQWGQLGLGDKINRILPSQIGTDINWVAIEASGDLPPLGPANANYNIGLKSEGDLWAWGYNQFGQLGLGDTIDRNTPSQIGTDSDWFTGAVGGYHTLRTKLDGTLWAWGRNNFGQLGIDTSGIKRINPTQVSTDSDWSTITAGYAHTIAIKNDCTIWSWGYNSSGQLGLNDINNRNTPNQIGTGSDWFSVTSGSYYALGIKTNGTLWSWGNNTSGQLGVGDNINRNTPTQIGNDSDWSRITAGDSHTLALRTTGIIWSWGNNNSGQLGLGDLVNRNTPTQIGRDSDWSRITAGNFHTLAIKENAIWSWGLNNSGQLGLGDTINRNTPALVGE